MRAALIEVSSTFPSVRAMERRHITKIGVGAAAAVVLALGGTAVARATGAFDDGDAQLTGLQAKRATAAALRVTGGGRANAVERDSEDGATYEVEVRRGDGSTVDVRLDETFRLVTIEGDSESGDSGDGH
jgi:hypothetical protein